MEKDDIVLMAARASRLENQDAIDFAIISMLPDPKEVENSPLSYIFIIYACSDDCWLFSSLK
jgi:hypothetical protein